MFFERRCPRCDRPARHVCAGCWGSLAGPAQLDVAHVDRSWALTAYDEDSQPIVLAAKNGGRRDILAAFGIQIARTVPRRAVDVVTWVPASRTARRRRGYDQGQIMARSAGRGLGVPSRALLRREGDSSQKGKSREERRLGPSFGVRRRVPPRVLLVDDVVATGASLEAASVALRRAGAEFIVAVTAAAAPGAAPKLPSIYIEENKHVPGSNRGANREEPPWR